jgi:hypothetical protein
MPHTWPILPFAARVGPLFLAAIATPDKLAGGMRISPPLCDLPDVMS